MEEAHDGDLIEPLSLPRIRDLITDIAPVMAQMAWLNPGVEGISCSCGVTHDTIESIKPLRECIECYSCVSSCPAFAASRICGIRVCRTYHHAAGTEVEP